MRRLIQTNLDPGNCWQTCVACLLDVDPEALPPQSEYERRIKQDDGSWHHVGPSYGNALQAYLFRHHDLAWTQLHWAPWRSLSRVVRATVPFMLCGETVRTKESGARHVVISEVDGSIWDPHPSQAGLIGEVEAMFIIDCPVSWRKTRETMPCECPACPAITQSQGPPTP